MSSGPTIATQAFWDAWYGSRQRCILVRIDFIVPSAHTIYLSDQEIVLDSTTWVQGILDADPIDAPGQFLSPEIARCSTRYRVADIATGGQTAGATLSDLIAAYKLQGATITEYLWEATLTDFATDALPSFRGVIDRVDQVAGDDGAAFDLWCIQGDTANVEIPPRQVDRIAFPNAPEDSIGKPIPIAYGIFINAQQHVPPFSAGATQWQRYIDSGAGSGAIPAIVTNRGVGGASITAIVLDHAAYQPDGHYASFVIGGDVLSRVDGTPFVTGGSPATSTIEVADGSLTAHIAVIPIDVDTATNTATDPRNALDVNDTLHYAVIDKGAGQDVLALILPNLGSLGEVVAVRAIIAMHTVSGAGAIEALYNGSNLGTLSPVGSDAEYIVASVPAGAWDQQWQWGSGASAKPFLVRATAASTTIVSHIYSAVLSVEYRPRRNVLIPPAYTEVKQRPSGTPITSPRARPDIPYTPFILGRREGVYEQTAEFYAHADVTGASGPGATSAQEPHTIAQHLLETYGGAAAGDFITSGWGSLTAAGYQLRREEPSYQLAVHIGEVQRIFDVLESLALHAIGALFMDRFQPAAANTGKWAMDIWTRGALQDGPNFGRDDVIDPRLNEVSNASVRNAIRVPWFYDFWRNKFLSLCSVDRNGSARGYALPEQGPNDLTIIAGVNDDLDWSLGASTYADVIDAGTYSPPMHLAANIRSKMRAHDSAMHVGHGFDFYESDPADSPRLDFKVGATTYVATLPDAHRISAEKAARLAEAALTAAIDNGWSVTFDPSTLKFTVTGTSSFDVLATTGANYATSAWPALGYYADQTGVTSAVSLATRLFDRFWIYTKTAGTRTLLFGSGASAATNCANVLGFEREDAGAASGGVLATYETGDRELRAADSYAAHGPREPLAPELRHIRSEVIAVDWVNRMFDLSEEPPVVWSFATDRAVDLQRRRVIAGAGASRPDMDMGAVCSMSAYGKGGDWDGLLWKVLSVRQHRVRAWHQEVSTVLVDG